MLLSLLLPSALAQASLEGWVFEAETGRPVPGVPLLLGDTPLLSDSEGHFAASASPGTLPLASGAWSTLVPLVEGQTAELLLTWEAGQIVYGQLEAAAPLAAPTQGPTGTLEGVLRDRETGQPLAEARVFVRGQPVEGRSDSEGHFVLTLPAGEYELSVLRSGYASASASAQVQADHTSTLTLDLLAADLALEDWTISAPRVEGGTAALLQERQASATVNEVLGAEEMARSGASDAASALTRVTGLTLVGGRYIFVRGLGERYSATTLDGSSLPSPEPERRVVPLDLFPSATLDSVVVQKTWTPDLPGEFGGGALQLRSRQIPETPTLRLGVSGGYVSQSTFTQAQVAPPGRLDWAGIDDGSRALPQPVAQAGTVKPFNPLTGKGYTADELEALGESFTNRWTLVPRTLPPDLGLSVTAGGSVHPGALKLGALAALSYNNTWDHNRYTRSFYNLGAEGVTPNQSYQFDEVEHTIRLGAMLALTAELGETRLHSTTALNRSTDDGARSYEGEYWDGGEIRVQRTRWVERQLFFQQLNGEHPLGALTLDWRYALSLANRDEPGRLEWSYENEPGVGWMQMSRASGFDMFYGSLRDRSHDAGLNLRGPLADLGTFQAGLWFMDKQRSSEVRRFYYELDSASPEQRAKPSAQWFTPETIGPEGMELSEFTNSSDDYTAQQRALAAYALADLSLSPQLRVLGGLRAERSVQSVQTYTLFSTSTDQPNAVAQLKTLDWLPALHGTWTLNERMQLRAGYARTLSRPDFRELSEVPFYDVSGGRSVVGNPNLRRASIHHADLRWELYPRPKESVSIGLFYKHFVDPIETVVEPGNENRVTFLNAPSANNLGLELEGRVALPHDFTLGGNLSLIYSRVDLSGLEGTQTSTVRPLQGQSPWVANVQLGYENPDSGSTVTLLYNAFGPRIEEVGIGGMPDTYERTVHRVDLVASQALPRGFRAQLKVQNLGNPVVRRTVGDLPAFEMTETWSASLGVSWGI